MSEQLKAALIALIQVGDMRTVHDLARDALSRFDPDDLEWQDLQLAVRKYEGKE